MKAWRRGLAILMILAMCCTGTPVSHAAELPGVQAVAAPETQPADPAPDPEEGVTDPAEWDGEEDAPAQEEEPAVDTDDPREDAGDPVPGKTDTDPADHVIAPEEFADAVFYVCILESFDTDGDGCLSVAEAEEVTEIDISGMEITDLGGIGSFSRLETLDCSENELDRLDLSANAALLHLNCGNNRLTSLDLSNNPLLETLDCSGNRLTLLDIRANTALTECVCNGNTRDITITGETFDPAELDPGFDPGRASDWTGASWDADRRLLTDLTGETITYRYEIGGDRYAAFTLTIPENEESSMEQAPGETAAEDEDSLLGVVEETEVPEILKDPGDPLELNGTGYPSFEEAFKHLDKTGNNDITLHADIAPGKFSFPTNITYLTIQSDGTKRTLTLPKTTSLTSDFLLTIDNVNIVSNGASSLTINAKRYTKLSEVSFTPTTNIVSAGNALFLTNVTGLGKLNGSSGDLYIYGGASVTEITNFSALVAPDPVLVSGKVSGINYFCGKLRMLSADKANTVVIKKAEDTLSLAYNNGAVTKATVTEVTGTLKVEVYDEGTDTLTKLPSGIPILTAGGTTDFTDHLWIDNKDAANHTLNAYAYNREIRAEFSGALTLNGTDYPNFEKAFENLVENAENTIELHTDLAPAKFALPTKKITKLSIIGDGAHDYDKRVITLPKVTSLAPGYKLFLKKVSVSSTGATSFAINAKDDIDLENVDFSPTANISVSANHSITLAGENCTGIGKVSGTNTSSLIVQGNVFVNEAANFKKVSIKDGKTFRVFGRVSGVDTLVKGTLRLSTFGTAVASVIKTVENAGIILDYDESQQAVLSKLTVTDVTTGLSIRVYNKDTVNLSSLPSGTPILTAGGTNDFTAKVTVENKDGTNPLKAYYYNKEIRAEYPMALDLNGKSYPSFEKAFENVTDGDNIITLYKGNAPAKFTLPAKMNSLTIDGQGFLLNLPKVASLAPAYDLTLKSLSIRNTDTAAFTINAKKNLTLVSVYCFDTTVNVSVPANSTLYLENTVKGLGKLTGTASSKLIADGNITVNEIATFDLIQTTPSTGVINVAGKVSGVNTLEGRLRMLSADKANTAVIKNVTGSSALELAYKGGDITKATVTNVFNDLRISVLNEDGTLVTLPSGTPVLTAGGATDFTNLISIENKDSDSHNLKAYYYNKEIRAEYSDALKLNGTSYPNFEKAFENLTEGDNTIELYADLAPVRFALPTKKMNSLTIKSNGYPKKLTLPKVTSLAPAFKLYLDGVEIVSSGATTFAINAKKDMILKNVSIYPDVNISVPAKSSLTLGEAVYGAGRVSGTNTSLLFVSDNVSVKELASLGTVEIAAGKTLNVTGNISGIGKLWGGTLRQDNLNNTVKTAVINTVEDAEIVFDYWPVEQKLASKVTVTDVGTALKVKVLNDGSGTVSSLPSGTPVLTAGGTKDFTDKVTIENKDGTNPLKAYRYNKEIRAEWASALTLNGTPYPGFEKAFENLTDGDNTIVLSADLAPVKFALPTKKMNSLTIKGDGTIRTLTLPKVTSLAPAYALALENVNIVSSGAASLTISARKDLSLMNTSIEPAPNIALAADASLLIKYKDDETVIVLGKVSGTPTSEIKAYGSIKMGEIANVGTVWTDPSNAFIRVSGKVSGVNVFEGHLRMGSADKASSVTIKEVRGNSTLRLAHKDNVIPKATITNVTGTLQITVNEEGTSTLSVIPSGFPILTAGGNTDFTDNITIKNPAAGGFTLTPKYYNKKIHAEYDQAVSLTIPSVGTFTSPDFNGIFEVIRNRPDSEEGTYKITVNTDIYAGKFTLPAKVDWLNITGEGTLPRTVTMVATSSLAPKYDMSLIGIKLENINANGVPTAFSISQSTGDLWLHEFVSETLSGITGTNNSKLALRDTATIDKISGFKLVNILSGNYTVGKTFSTTNLFIGAGSTITVPDGCTITAANITCEGTGGLIKLKPGFKPLTISGKESAGTIKLVSDTPIEDDVQILNSANCPLGVFDVSGIKGGSTDYCLSRTGSKVTCRKAAFLMNSVRYATFADMVSEIERVKDPTAVYDIKMQSDYDAAGALKFPKAGTCGEIKVIGSDYTITFTGNLSLTGNTSLNTVTLRSVNAAGASAAYTMTVTNGDLSASGVNFGDITAITAANRKISLNVVTLGSKPVKIAAKEFSFMKVIGMVDSLTVDTIAATGSDDAQNTLKMLEKKQSRVNVGITDSSHMITFYYVKADGTDAPLVKGTVLFTVFRGNWDYTHNVWTDPFGASRDPKTFRVTASLH